MILQEVFAPVDQVKPLSKDQMNTMDEAREQDDFVIPELEKPAPGFFDGMGEATWKGVASGALKSASALDTALSGTGMVRAALNNAQVETGYMFDDIEGRTQHVENLLDQDSKALRKRARDEFGIDPETMGTAAQIMYGVAETIPKAIGYSVLAGPSGGSLLFGADLGISRAQELMDEGVDKDTAINAGMVTFAAGALGMKLPATFGRSRIASATIGAAANVGLTAAEMQGVNWVLQNQNYKELSQKYQLNGIDLATSAIFGGVMGGVLWRPGMNPSRPQTAKERSVPLQERIKRQLREASPETISDEAIETQAVVQATGIQVMADRAQIDVDSIAPEIVRGDATDGLNQIIGERGAASLDQATETTIRMDNRGVAEIMGLEGKTAKQIRLATGWERGADGKWRYEIPDIQIKDGAFRVIEEADAARDAEQAALWERTDLADDEYIDQDVAIADKYEKQTLSTKLDEVVDAPELFRAYPQLKDLTVEFGELPRLVGAYYDSVAKVIRLDRRAEISQRTTRSNLAHEIQHAIQDIEGFARGSNLEENSFANALHADLQSLYAMMRDSEAWKTYRETQKQAVELWDESLTRQAEAYAENPEVQAILREQDRLRDKYGTDSDVSAVITDYHRRSDPIWQKIHENHLEYARQRYSRSAGEVEARNVQDRLDLSDDARQNSTLQSTEDVPRGEQIVRYSRRSNTDSSFSNSDFVPDEDLIQRAKDNFGVTNDVREAFYVLPDGTMLDGSGRHWGGDERDVAGQRQVDHGDIGEIIDDSTGPADAMYKWMARSGAMRFDQIVGIASIARKPTPQQLAVLSRASRGKYLALSFNTPEGRIIDDVEFESASPVAIRHFFEDAQIKAANGVAGAFAQRAWHGSPHTFDRFSTEHIGTGEGAQAHGWGLYFAENRMTAEGYRIRLSDRSRQANQVLDEFDWTDIDPFEQIDSEQISTALDNGEFSPQTAELLSALEENQWLGFSTPAQAIRAALSDLPSFEATPRLQQAVEAFGDSGRVFEVDIPDTDSLLDEQKYMGSSRNTELRGKIEFIIQEWDRNNPGNPLSLPESPNGREIYNAISDALGGPKEASLYLNRFGIKGLTYEGLRDGRCYVVFDDKAIQTIEFYQNLANRNVVAEIEGTEFATEIDQAKSGKPSALIKKAVELIKTIGDEVPLDDRLSKGTWERSINNDEIGDIRITTRGSKELRGEAIDYPENLLGLPALDAVLQHGKFEGWLPNRKKDKKPNVEAYGRLRADVLIGGEVRRVSVQLERYNNGKAYYFIETEKPSLARNFSQLSTASVEGSPSVANDTINIEVESIAPTTRGSFSPALNRITLTANANISTYSHEMGHWYLENLFQLSRRAVAENTLKEDANILLKEFGIKSVDDWDNLGVDGQRKYQEQFASWVEIYLSEGRAPKPTLQRVFERLGQWLVDLYRELGGVKKAVGDTYKAEVGEELPPVSDEVAKVLDRLFANDRAVRKASRVSKSQVAAARMVQANRTNNSKLEEIIAMPDGKEKSRALRDLEKSTKAQLKAIEAMRKGLPVDVSKDVEQMDVDTDHLIEMKGNFGRAYVMGNTDSAVVLQNRDRSSVAAQNQMRLIAANPQYGLASVSRDYSGAPIVSYGTVPDNAHLGNNDFLYEANGNRVPFVYAVVEAGDVETSNFIDGSTNADYGNPQKMNAVIGNGRMTGLKEAYQRGTADQYRADFEADTAHGIKPEVIREMKNPILVRVINPEDVTTDLISRSNAGEVMDRSAIEVAFEDAPKIRENASRYEFDDNGKPTNETLRMFVRDIGANDANSLGRLINRDGSPSSEAVDRIKNAVFMEAYQNDTLLELYATTIDPGIRRVLNGMALVAPRIIQLRQVAQQLDFSDLLVQAANRIREARLNPNEGDDFAAQTSFLDDPASRAFVEFLDDNANSAAGIARVLNPLIDWAEAVGSADEGGLFGSVETEIHDLASVVGQLRHIVNEQRTEAGLEPLPEIDINALRGEIQARVDEAADAVDEVSARLEAETTQAEADLAAQAEAVDAQRQQSMAVLDEKTSLDARAEFVMEQNPEQVFRMLDENGMEVEGTLGDLLAQADEEIRQAEIEAAGTGRAVECVLRNGGI